MNLIGFCYKGSGREGREGEGAERGRGRERGQREREGGRCRGEGGRAERDIERSDVTLKMNGSLSYTCSCR